MKTFKEFVSFLEENFSFEVHRLGIEDKKKEDEKKKEEAKERAAKPDTSNWRREGIKGTRQGVSGTFYNEPATGRNTKFVPDGR